MRKEVSVKIADKYKSSYANGYPLIMKESLADSAGLEQEEGAILKLVDSSGRFLAKAYFGKQNKGLGWVLTRKEEEAIDQAFIQRKLRQAIAERKNLFNSPDTTAFRVFNGEGDGIGGLTIDFYDGFYMLSWYSEGIYSFKDEVVSALKETVDFKGIYQKKRFDAKGQYI